jgi:hypothetical protein
LLLNSMIGKNWVQGPGKYGKASAWLWTIWESECLGLDRRKVIVWAWTIGKWVLSLDCGKVSAWIWTIWESECSDLGIMGKRVLGCGQYGEVSAWAWTVGKCLLGPEQYSQGSVGIWTMGKWVLGPGSSRYKVSA